MAQNRRARFITGRCMFYATECRATHKVLNHRLPCPAPLVPLAHNSSLFLYVWVCTLRCVLPGRCAFPSKTLPVMKHKRAILPRIIERPAATRAETPSGSGTEFSQWIVRRDGLATPRYVYSSCIIETLSRKIDSVFDMISPSSFK